MKKRTRLLAQNLKGGDKKVQRKEEPHETKVVYRVMDFVQGLM